MTIAIRCQIMICLNLVLLLVLVWLIFIAHPHFHVLGGSSRNWPHIVFAAASISCDDIETFMIVGCSD